MQLEDKIIGNMLCVKINGHITGISEVSRLKDIISMNADNVKIIELEIRDAYVIPSMLIGLLMKEAKKDQKQIRLLCVQKELKQLLSDLNLDTVFEVKMK